MLFDMIIQDIRLDNWNWNVRVYYDASSKYVDTIIDDMKTIGANNDSINNLYTMLLYGGRNCGFTYTNGDNNASIIVIGKTTNAEQFQNTFDHEKGHLATHIAQILNINLYGEEYQYLIGDIGLKLFKVAKQYLCDTCRHKLNID